jgi:hypothetical protein
MKLRTRKLKSLSPLKIDTNTKLSHKKFDEDEDLSVIDNDSVLNAHDETVTADAVLDDNEDQNGSPDEVNAKDLSVLDLKRAYENMSDRFTNKQKLKRRKSTSKLVSSDIALDTFLLNALDRKTDEPEGEVEDNREIEVANSSESKITRVCRSKKM